MSVFEFTNELWPILKAHFKGHQTDDDIETFIQGLHDALDKKEPTGLIMVMDIFATNLSHVRKLAMFTKENFQEAKEFGRGVAFVAEGNVFRLLLSAFWSITPLPCPHRVFSSEEEGLRWLHAKIKQ